MEIPKSISGAYAQARKDHEFLWETYAPAYDMTGGYVEEDDLAKLLKSPTKRTACAAYIDQIVYWLQVGPDPHDPRGQRGNWRNDSIVHRIRDRYLPGQPSILDDG